MMTQDELRRLVHRLDLEPDMPPQLVYIFYQDADGFVHNLTVSRQRGRKPLTDSQLADIMQAYPAAADAKRGLTQWLDATDVCRRLGTSRQTLRRWVQRQLLHPSRMGRRLYFDPGEVEALLRSNIIQDNGRLDSVGRH